MLYVYKNEQQLGPFDESQISEALSRGEFSSEDLAWKEGLNGWVMLGDLLQNTQKMTAPAEERPPVYSNLTPQSISDSGAHIQTIVVNKNEPLSIWALVLGILSLVSVLLGFIPGIPAVICGHLGLSRIKRQPFLGGRGMAIAGLITGYLGIMVSCIFLAIPVVWGTMEFVVLPKIAQQATATSSARLKDAKDLFFPLGEVLVVPLSGTPQSLRMGITISITDSKNSELIKKKEVNLRDAATTVVLNQPLTSFDNRNGREEIRKQLIARFNSIVGAGVIDDIYFTEFTIR
jgi:flagellar basal body-associated protein FliL